MTTTLNTDESFLSQANSSLASTGSYTDFNVSKKYIGKVVLCSVRVQMEGGRDLTKTARRLDTFFPHL